MPMKSKQDVRKLIEAWPVLDTGSGNFTVSELVDLATLFYNEGLITAANMLERDGNARAGSMIDCLQIRD
jgi:hypothetical protein